MKTRERIELIKKELNELKFQFDEEQMLEESEMIYQMYLKILDIRDFYDIKNKLE